MAVDWFELVGRQAGGAQLLSFTAVPEDGQSLLGPTSHLTYCPLPSEGQWDRSEAGSATELAIPVQNENVGPCSKGPENLKPGPSEHRQEGSPWFTARVKQREDSATTQVTW